MEATSLGRLARMGLLLMSMTEPVAADADLDRSAVDRLDAATQWLITDGLATARDFGVDRLKKVLIEGFAVQLWVTPETEPERGDVAFRIKSRGINTDVVLVATAPVDGLGYEYWTAKTSAREWSAPIRRARFWITSATAAWGPRTILERSEVFIPAFALGERRIFDATAFPLAAVYRLEPWAYPDQFVGSPWTGIRVWIDEGGTYRTMPLDPAPPPKAP